jgi:hypothetical protein
MNNFLHSFLFLSIAIFGEPPSANHGGWIILKTIRQKDDENFLKKYTRFC